MKATREQLLALPSGIYLKGWLAYDAEYNVGNKPRLEFIIKYEDDKKNGVFCNCIVWDELATRLKGLRKGTMVCLTKGYGNPGTYKGQSKVKYVVKELVVLDDSVVIPEPEPEPEPITDPNDFL